MLTPLALQNVEVLRVLAARWTDTPTALARRFNRDKDNFRKTLKLLEAEGLITGLALTTRGGKALEWIDLANSADPINLRHAQIRANPRNARQDWDSDGARQDLAELADDIAERGVLQNLIVRPLDRAAQVYELLGGERRWRAVDLLIDDGRWPADRALPVKVLDTDDALALRLAAMSENKKRRPLSPIEEALEFKGLMDDFGLDTDALAQRANVTRRTVQMRLDLLNLPQDDQARMALPKADPEHLTVRQAMATTRRARADAAKPAAKSKDTPAVKALRLEPVLALAVLELADKIDRAPVTVSGEPEFTRIKRWPAFHTPLDRLNALKIVTFKRDGQGRVFAKILRLGSGVALWLAEVGFADQARRAALLDAARSAVGAASALDDHYATRELNVDDHTPPEEGDDQIPVNPEPIALDADSADPREPAAGAQVDRITLHRAQLADVLAEIERRCRLEEGDRPPTLRPGERREAYALRMADYIFDLACQVIAGPAFDDAVEAEHARQRAEG